MAYKIEFLQQAEAEFRNLDKTIEQRIHKKLKWFSENFDTMKPDPLTGELKGLFKLRMGSYRIVYSANNDEKIISVHMIGHRKDIYKLK